MIKKFTNIANLLTALKKDRQSIVPSNQRYPVRFIFVNRFSTFTDIMSELYKSCSSIIDLSTKLPHDDGWYTPNDLKKLLNIKEKNVCVLPASEILRFTHKNKFNAILRVLFELENQSDSLGKRIYLPMIGLWDRFTHEFYNTYHRREEFPDIWKIDEDYDPKITIYHIYFSINTNHKIIKNTFDWLKFWKNERHDFIFSSSKSLEYLYSGFLPDDIFCFRKIYNYKDYIKIILNIDVPIVFTKSKMNYWKQLAFELEANKKYGINDFMSFICKKFNRNIYSEVDTCKFINLFIEEDDEYNRWLLKSFYIKHLDGKSSYLGIVLKNMINTSFEEFVELIWMKIFELETIDIWFDQRRQIIKYIHKTLLKPYSFIETKIWKKLNEFKSMDFSEQLKYITNVSFSERKYIFYQLSASKKPTTIIHLMESIYPELYHYLSWSLNLKSKEDNDWIIKYFKEYCYSKAFDNPTKDLLSLLDKFNLNAESFYNWYYNLESYPDIKDSIIIWIDGLGAEWLSYIVYLVNKYGVNKRFYINKLDVVRVEIPSTTDMNRHQNAVHIRSLDEFIHNQNPYCYPNTLIEEFSIIDKIIREELNMSGNRKITIVSDHGFTFLAQKKYGNFKKFSFKNADHEGRCMWTQTAMKNDDVFLYHDYKGHTGTNCLIALKHTSMDKTPFREVHGGATPEEIIVPYIEISAMEKDIEYKVQLPFNEITVTNPRLLLKVYPDPITQPTVKIDNKIFNFQKEGDLWIANLSKVMEGKYKIVIKIDKKEYVESLKIKGGLEEVELF